ncbi:MAG TPA: hypothetical protein VNN55_10125 [bacterium]|nr:hypothetical protein [bacterium]
MLVTATSASAADNRPSFCDGDGLLARFAEWVSVDVFDGRGTSVTTDGFGRTTATWSDGTNKLKVRIEGTVKFGEDDRTIDDLSKSGRILIWEKRDSRVTELDVRADRQGDLDYEYNVDGRERPFDDAGRAWLATVLVDLIRKTGIGAEERANRILDRDGVPGLIAEVAHVESDYVLRRFVGEAFKRPALTAAECSDILEVAAMRMESDYEKAELLLTVAEHRNWDPSLTADYVAVASTMDSDYEIRRALSAIELDAKDGPEVMNAVLQIAARMESDYETAELLISFAPQCTGSERLMPMYVDAAAGIESGYEARRALTALDWRSDPPVEAVVGALRIAARMESDYEAAELLGELVPQSRDGAAATNAFMSAVAAIESDYDAARALTGFTDTPHLNAAATRAALAAARGISSSYEQGGVLRSLLPHCRGDEALEDEFLAAADDVDGDYEREQLYSEFYRADREARRDRRGD